ncbi:nitronate monooxygenase, partial [Candidatus Frankia nodulisporulans]
MTIAVPHSLASSTGRDRCDPLTAADLVVVITPFAEPAPALVAAVTRAGGRGVLDLGRSESVAHRALRDATRWTPGAFGVRVGTDCPLAPRDLPDAVDLVVLAAGAPERGWSVGEVTATGRQVWVEVTSVGAAVAAIEAGATGLLARGNESGGAVGDLTTFTLLQHLLAEDGPSATAGRDVPVFAAGGIGLATAAAAVAGGAAGVVLDAQLALVQELELPERVAAAIRAMDGSETALYGGHRLYTRPDLPIAGLVGSGRPVADLRATGGEIASDGALSVTAPRQAEHSPDAAAPDQASPDDRA